MTDKEFKRLTRAQLIEIIYQLQLNQEELAVENDRLSKALEDKRILLENAGNVAQAVLKIHGVMQSAQDAAVHYQQEMQARADEEYLQIINKAKEEARKIISCAQQEVDMEAQTQKIADCDI